MLSNLLSNSLSFTYVYIMQNDTRMKNITKCIFEHLFHTVCSCFKMSQLKPRNLVCHLERMSTKLGTILNQQLFTVKTLCSYLSISRATLYRLIKKGKIEPLHIGSSTRFTESEVERFITRQQRQTRSQEVGF
jgi:excisionase family DNA binding protein